MIRLAIHDFPTFRLSEFELQRKNVSYTIDTIRHFKKTYPDAGLFWLIGRDNIKDFFDWKEADEILNTAQVVVYDRVRTETTAPDSLDARFKFISCPLVEISSSMIRERLRNNRPVQSLLHPDVSRFITEKKLYSSHKK